MNVESKRYSIYFVFCWLIIGNCSAGAAADQTLRFALPEATTMAGKSQCRCSAIVGVGVYANDLYHRKEILGTLSSGTDKINISIEDGYLNFLSSASFIVGETEAAIFEIIFNDNDKLIAISHQKANKMITVDVFTLNRNNGLAVWTKTRTNDLFSGGNPSGQSYYLKCE